MLPRTPLARAAWNYHLLRARQRHARPRRAHLRHERAAVARCAGAVPGHAESHRATSTRRRSCSTITYHHPVYLPAGVAAQKRRARNQRRQPHVLLRRVLALRLPRRRRRQREWALEDFARVAHARASSNPSQLARGGRTSAVTWTAALYTGWIQHRRFGPARNRVSLSTVHAATWISRNCRGLFDQRWFWSARRPALALVSPRGLSRTRRQCRSTHAVRDLVAAAHRACGPPGPIRLLTHLRYFGYSFNPVSFYYCFDATGTRVETIVAEITNTPWKERHAYVLPVAAASAQRRGAWRFSFDKQFHVSPFMPMDMRYDWRFSAPARGPARSHGKLARRRRSASTPR